MMNRAVFFDITKGQREWPSEVEETFRFASTAPWYLEIGGRPMKPQREAASFFLAWSRERLAMVRQALDDPQQRNDVAAAHELAVSFWEDMLDRAE